MSDGIELDRRREVAAERLLDDDPGIAREACRAEARSRPNGFSSTTRAPLAQPLRPSDSTTAGKRLGGIAR